MVALVTVGVGGSIDTTNIKDPIVVFAFDQKGLMYNLTIEGSKFSKKRRLKRNRPIKEQHIRFITAEKNIIRLHFLAKL